VHEIGHTLGLAHNFAGSTYGRASVMDYPAPLVKIDGDRLDLSEAYAKGVGAWDRFAINWLYSQGAPGSDEAARLDRLARD
uniref:zinc-dependent metalloprotease n=2 Tax=Bacteria TaxID=2 RepID=UPI00178C7B1A